MIWFINIQNMIIFFFVFSNPTPFGYFPLQKGRLVSAVSQCPFLIKGTSDTDNYQESGGGR